MNMRQIEWERERKKSRWNHLFPVWLIFTMHCIHIPEGVAGRESICVFNFEYQIKRGINLSDSVFTGKYSQLSYTDFVFVCVFINLSSAILPHTRCRVSGFNEEKCIQIADHHFKTVYNFIIMYRQRAAWLRSEKKREILHLLLCAD